MSSTHQLKRLRDVWSKLQEANLDQHPYVRQKWALACVPNARVSEKFCGMLEGLAERELLKKQLISTKVVIPTVSGSAAVPFGRNLMTGHPVAIHRDVLCRHVLEIGTTGSGKSTLNANVMSWAYEHGVQCIFSDHKGCEGARLLNLFDDVLILRPDQFTENLLAAPCRSLANLYYSAFFAEFARAFGLLPGTATQLLTIMERVERGMGADQDWPNLRQWEGILHRQGKDRKKFGTAAHCIAALNSRLGPAADIRKGVKPSARIIVYRWHGCTPREQQFLSAVQSLRVQMASMAEGFTSNLKTLCFLDEALNEYGKEHSQGSGSGYISIWKRAITQSRAYGQSILASVQSISQTDDILKANAGTVIVLKTPHPPEAMEALQLVGAPTSWVPKIQNLSAGQALLRSEGFSAPVFVQLPHLDLGDYPCDAEIDARMAPKLAALERDITRTPSQTTAAPIFFEDAPSDEKDEEPPRPEPPAAEEEFVPSTPHLCLLANVRDCPDASVSERYQALGLSAGKGTRIKDELIKHGMLGVLKRKVGNHAPLKILKLTDAGRKILSANSIP